MSVMRYALAATLLAGGGLPARALDRKPAPEFSSACAGYGPGFQVVPGTRTCVRVSGRVRSEVQAGSTRTGVDRARMNAEARMSVDARSETDYGPLRTYVRVRAKRGDPNNR